MNLTWWLNASGLALDFIGVAGIYVVAEKYSTSVFGGGIAFDSAWHRRLYRGAWLALSLGFVLQLVAQFVPSRVLPPLLPSIALLIPGLSAVSTVLVGILAGVAVWRHTREIGQRISVCAQVAAGVAAMLVAIGAWGLLGYQRAEYFANARAILNPRVLQPPVISPTPKGDMYARVMLDVSNASQYQMGELSIFYSHWDGGSWLGGLPWFDEHDRIPPSGMAELQHRRGYLGAETHAAPDTLFADGKKLYFAVRATWFDPNGAARCDSFYIAIFPLLYGFTAEGPRVRTAWITDTLAEGVKPPEEEKLPPCRRRDRDLSGIGSRRS